MSQLHSILHDIHYYILLFLTLLKLSQHCNYYRWVFRQFDDFRQKITIINKDAGADINVITSFLFRNKNFL